MKKRFLLFQLLFLLGGCELASQMKTSDTKQEVPASLTCEFKTFSEAFHPGGVYVKDGTIFYCESYGCPKELVDIPSEATALHLVGWFHNFKREAYENVTMLHWNFWCAWRSHTNCPLRNKGMNDNEIFGEMLGLLSCFPNLEYLTLDTKWPNKDDALLKISLDKLLPLKKLRKLSIEGDGCVVLGIHKALAKMEMLRTLTIRGDATWMSLNEENDVGGAVIVPSLLWLGNLLIEDLNLTGCVLLEQDSLLEMKHLKRLVPPIYYCLGDIVNTVEELDTTQSERPLDGYASLRRFDKLRKIIVYSEDEVEVRHFLGTQHVEIVVVPHQDHDGRERWRRW